VDVTIDYASFFDPPGVSWTFAIRVGLAIGVLADGTAGILPGFAAVPAAGDTAFLDSNHHFIGFARIQAYAAHAWEMWWRWEGPALIVR
jgi:hypothetical protein